MIVDERSAGFFALGAAQATRPAGRRPVHLGHRRGQPAPRGLRGRRGRRPADRPHRRPPAGAARDRRRSDDRPAEALRIARCAGSARSAPTRPTTPGCCTSARSPAAPTPRRAGEPRPGRCTSTSPGASRWRRSPTPGTSTATSPLALEGRGDRPLTAVASTPPRADEALIDELAERMSASPRGLILAGRQPDPRLAEPVAALARAAGLPGPRRADLAAAPRCPRPRARRLGLRRDRPPAARRAGARARDPLRRHADEQGAAPVARARLPSCGRSSSTRRSAGTSPPTGPRRSCGPRRDRSASGLAERLERLPRSRGELPGWRPGGRPRRPIEAEAATRSTEPTEPGSARGARAPVCRRGPRLHRVVHADPRPGGVRAAGRDAGALPLQPRRERDRRADLLGNRRRRRQRPAHLDRHRRPRPLPRHERASRRSPRERPGADRRAQQRRRRDLRVPAPGRGSSIATSSRRCSGRRWGSTRRGSPRCTACLTRAWSGWTGLADAAGRGPALIEVPVDRRRNVELHRRIAERVGEALGARQGA